MLEPWPAAETFRIQECALNFHQSFMYALDTSHVACVDSFARGFERCATVFLPNLSRFTNLPKINIYF
jgi:hypothetical protein